MNPLKFADLIVCIIMNLLIIAGWLVSLFGDTPVWNTPGIIFACFVTIASLAMLCYMIHELKNSKK